MGELDSKPNEIRTMGQASITLDLSNAIATQQLGERLGRCLPAGTVLLLEGTLGSGKTTLVQGLGTGLGIPDALVGSINSPTFTLINEYLNGRVPLYHVDLYRLSPEEADTLYLETYWQGEEVEPGILAIEWAERLRYLPESPIRLVLTYDDNGGRQAEIWGIDEAQKGVCRCCGRGSNGQKKGMG